MCGISGIINKNNTSVQFQELKKITDIVAHRGPDGEGFLIENNLGLGHRRLAILDLTHDGNQPMDFEKYSIVFNGEIYNYLELKVELQKLGYSFRTNSDTEVILVSYKCWGVDCVKRFNGMWAFSLYDRVNNILFCSRDRFGVKPFYYFESLNQFVFGSEIKQLISYSDLTVNKKVLLEYLVLNLEEQSENTFFNGIKRLLPSHNLIYNLNTNTYHLEQYYTLNFKPEINRLSLKQSINQLKSDLIDSIKLRLRSDVEVGTCLSGGLDSSTIASVVSKEFKIDSNFKGIHAKSTEKYTDESKYAELVANATGIKLHCIEPSEDYFKNNIEKLALIHDEPIGGPSVFMQYAVFEKAKEEGCIVMLDGQGGDETLLGYERYFPCLLTDMSFFKKILELFKYSRKSRLSFSDTILFYFYFKYPSIRTKRLLRKWNFLKKEFLLQIDTSILKTIAEAYKSPFELQKLEITKTQLPHLLKCEDRNSMIHSIESRLPFLDYRLVENAISYKAEYKINDGWSKFLLRNVTEQFAPSDIAWRRNKRGFESPRNWLYNKNYFLSIINDSKIVSRITSKVDESYSEDVIWKLFSVAIWEKTFNVSID